VADGIGLRQPFLRMSACQDLRCKCDRARALAGL